MIEMYNGTPGSGKSLHMAKRIRNRAGLAKKPTICNFDVTIPGKENSDYVICIDNSELTPKFLKDYSKEYFKDKKRKESQILLMVDEAQIPFNAREWNKPGRKEWLDFFTNHRKYGYDIILICQFPKMLDSQIRSLVEYQYIHRKISNFGALGFLMSLIFLGKLFCCVKVWYPIGEKVGSTFFTARKKYYTIYDTFKCFDGEES